MSLEDEDSMRNGRLNEYRIGYMQRPAWAGEEAASEIGYLVKDKDSLCGRESEAGKRQAKRIGTGSQTMKIVTARKGRL